MRKISDLLGGAIQQSEVLRSARAQTATSQWEKIVGEHISLNSFPDRYRHGVLWVVVDGSAWGQEILFRKDYILGELNKRMGEKDFFRELRVSHYSKRRASEEG